MTLSHDLLRRSLTRKFRYFQSVDSTNDLAKTWLLRGAPDGALVIADEQRKGRGRHGRVWRSPAGATLALSMILTPDDAEAARVNMIGALGVHDVAQQLGCAEVGIKWPNDVQIKGKKVSGILVENVWQSDSLVGIVLGIGVNVRVDFRGSDLQDTATSLEQASGLALQRVDLIGMLLERIDYWRRMDASLLFAEWKKRLNTIGKPVTVDGLSGLALDVRPNGALLIETADGAVRPVYVGDVREHIRRSAQ